MDRIVYWPAKSRHARFSALEEKDSEILDATFMVRVNDTGISHFVAEGRSILNAIVKLRLLEELRDDDDTRPQLAASRK